MPDEERNKKLVLEAFETLFNRRDYATAERYWSADYIQHSAHIPPGREGLFALIKAAPPTLKYENALTLVDGDIVMLRERARRLRGGGGGSRASPRSLAARRPAALTVAQRIQSATALPGSNK